MSREDEEFGFTPEYTKLFLESYETRCNSRGAMEGVTFNVKPEDIRIFEAKPREKPYTRST